MPKKHFILKNRKIRFREKDYVEKNYIQGNKAVIPIKLNSIKDLYMKHDYKNLALSDELCNYIKEIAYIIPFEYPIELEFHCPKISLEEQDRIRKVIKNNYGMEIDDCDYDVKVINKKCRFLFVVGVLLLFLSFGLENKIPSFIEELIYIAGSLAIWDMLEYLIFDNPEKRIERLNKLQLYDSEVTFVFDK